MHFYIKNKVNHEVLENIEWVNDSPLFADWVDTKSDEQGIQIPVWHIKQEALNVANSLKKALGIDAQVISVPSGVVVIDDAIYLDELVSWIVE